MSFLMNPLYVQQAVMPEIEANAEIAEKVEESAAGVAANALDIVLPDAVIVGVGGDAGFIGALGGGGEIVKNYKTGEISAFGYISKSVGWQLAGGSGYFGLAWNLEQNKDYAGQFLTAEGSGAVFGAALSVSGNGSEKGLFAEDPVISLTGGLAFDVFHFVDGFSGSIKNSDYSDPKQIGPEEMRGQLLPSGALDTLLTVGHSALKYLNEKAGR